MARKNAAKPESKSDFLRRVLSRNPNLDYDQILRRWTRAGHPGTISNPLYYVIRRELGIVTEWTWGPADAAPPRRPRRADPPTEVYQFKITLKESDPPIWRRIQVGDCSLDQLHEHIQTAMGWTNSHLNQFRINETWYADPLLMEEDFKSMGYRDSTTTMISEILSENGERFGFEYEYDFGDSWMHEILFEGRLPADPGVKYPLCLEGARACPPEDVGGVWGYADFVQAIGDPKHDRYLMFKDWINGNFDPEAFDATTATKRMKRGLPDWRRMR